LAGGAEDAEPSPRDEALPAIDARAPITKVGDLILLGEHRLYVGDSREVHMWSLSCAHISRDQSMIQCGSRSANQRDLRASFRET
jgi:hypothetical protein